MNQFGFKNNGAHPRKKTLDPHSKHQFCMCIFFAIPKLETQSYVSNYLDLLVWCLEKVAIFSPNGGVNVDLPWYNLQKITWKTHPRLTVSYQNNFNSKSCPNFQRFHFEIDLLGVECILSFWSVVMNHLGIRFKKMRCCLPFFCHWNLFFCIFLLRPRWCLAGNDMKKRGRHMLMLQAFISPPHEHEKSTMKTFLNRVDTLTKRVPKTVTLPSNKLTWQWKTTVFNRRYIFNWLFFNCDVNFPGSCWRKTPPSSIYRPW